MFGPAVAILARAQGLAVDRDVARLAVRLERTIIKLRRKIAGWDTADYLSNALGDLRR
jgi:hypothetical protein